MSSRDDEEATTLAPPGKAAPGEPSAPPGDETWRYEIGTEVARGGLGRIHRAVDRKLGRTVALKRTLVRDEDLERRFLREAVITARLAHPGIVPVYDTGSIGQDGELFYSMKLVGGRTLDEVIAGAPTYRDRVALLPTVVAVTDAMAYAHSQKVVHRDLKPANILCGEFGEAVVIDWGLAKRLDAGEDEQSGPGKPVEDGLTAIGAVVGTPAYMAPEQAAGEPADARSDVYALGSVLYHVLAGVTPYGVGALKALRAGPPRPLEERVPEVHPDLAAIVEKAMARAPADRYPTAEPMAADLKRFTTGQLVSARSYSPWQLLGRWISRHRLVVGVSSLAVVLLAATGILAVTRVIRERDLAELRENELRLANARAVLATDPTSAVACLKSYRIPPGSEAAAREVASDAASRGVARSVFPLPQGSAGHVVFSRTLGLVADSARGLELLPWDGRTAHAVPLEVPVVRALAARADGVVAIGGQGQVGILRAAGEAPRWLRGGDGAVTVLAFAPDAEVLYGGDDRGGIWRWDLPTGAGEALDGGGPAVNALVAAPGRVAAGTDAGVVLVWQDGGVRRVELDAPVQALAWLDADLVIASYDGAVRRMAPGLPPRELGRSASPLMALALVRGEIATVAMDGAVTLWPAEGGEPRLVARHGGGLARVLVADARADWLLSAGPDGLAVLVSPDGVTRSLLGHREYILEASFDPTGRWVATSDRLEVRVWPIAGDGPRVVPIGPAAVRRMVVLGDGSIVVATRAGKVRRVDRGGTPSDVVDHGFLADVSVAAARDRFATAGDDGQVVLWSQTGERVGAWKHEGSVRVVAIAPGGERVASGGNDGSVRVWSSAGPSSCAGHEGAVFYLVWSRDGASLASVGADGAVRICGGQALLGHTGPVLQAAWDPSGRRLASAGSDGDIRLWDVSAGTSVVLRQGGGVAAVVFSPDGTELASAGQDPVVCRWNLIGTPSKRCDVGHIRGLLDVAYSPDGRLLASASSDGTARLWGDRARVLRGHRGSVNRVLFDPTGTTLITGGDDGTIRVWPVGPSRPAEGLASLLDELTTALPPR